jgi:DNA-binding MarR family transcriptional regulator
MPERDVVDSMLDQWRRERPDIDRSAMGVVGRISRLRVLFEHATEEALRPHGLMGPEFDVLAGLRRAGPPFRLTPTELHRALMVGSGTLSHRLERLERRGLIRRHASREDRRKVTVELTQRGRRVVDAAAGELVEAQERMLAGLSRSDRRQLAPLLRRLLISLEGPSA